MNCYFFADIEECEDQTHNCDINAHCDNTDGSFSCTCFQGYSGDGVICSGMIDYATLYYSFLLF